MTVLGAPACGPVLMEGWAFKRGPTIDYKWMRRWCVLRPGALEYYADDQCAVKKGVVPLPPKSRLLRFNLAVGAEVEFNPRAPGDAIKHHRERPFGFVIDMHPAPGKKRRLFYLDAGSSAALEAWSGAIEQAMGATSAPEQAAAPRATTPAPAPAPAAPPPAKAPEGCAARSSVLRALTSGVARAEARAVVRRFGMPRVATPEEMTAAQRLVASWVRRGWQRRVKAADGANGTLLEGSHVYITLEDYGSEYVQAGVVQELLPGNRVHILTTQGDKLVMRGELVSLATEEGEVMRASSTAHTSLLAGSSVFVTPGSGVEEASVAAVMPGSRVRVRTRTGDELELPMDRVFLRAEDCREDGDDAEPLPSGKLGTANAESKRCSQIAELSTRNRVNNSEVVTGIDVVEAPMTYSITGETTPTTEAAGRRYSQKCGTMGHSMSGRSDG